VRGWKWKINTESRRQAIISKKAGKPYSAIIRLNDQATSESIKDFMVDKSGDNFRGVL
jgi:hypothetical protein